MVNDVFTPAEILLPSNDLMNLWSVIACDQFSSEREYWQSVRSQIGDAPSTLNMIIPEAYLGEIDEEAAIEKICASMDEYVSQGILREITSSFVYVERTLGDGSVRKGIVGAVDLEEYEFRGTDAAILASEATVLDRLPARIRIRRAAQLEIPHIMAFIDDVDATIIEPLAGKTDSLPQLYNFKLMESGGYIAGWQVTGTYAESVMNAIRVLQTKNRTLIVIGDGNHSLASAKVFWDEIKQSLNPEERETHPARRALLEINNVYDPSIVFEAIHRVAFGIDPTDFETAFKEAMPAGGNYELRWVAGSRGGTVGIYADCIGDVVKTVQSFLDDIIERKGCTIDYVHDEDSVIKLGSKPDCAGIILPAMDKSDLFDTVTTKGIFPKKSFSVGHARDKRYYLECRKITAT